MAILGSNQEPFEANDQERMQRIRIGVTGLAFIILMLAVAGAISSGIDQRATQFAVDQGVDPVPINNATGKANVEPLTQLGVAPDAQDSGPRHQR